MANEDFSLGDLTTSLNHGVINLIPKNASPDIIGVGGISLLDYKEGG
jgi:hypothetical protein